MNFKNFTAVIPTIGRPSIIDSIKSVPIESKIIVAVDYKFSKVAVKSMVGEYLKDKSRLKNITFVRGYKEGGPGYTKQAGIDRVKTAIFGILDDDDQYNQEDLYIAIREFNNKNYDYVVASNDRTTTSKVIKGRKDFYNRLFEFEKYSPEYERNHIYTGGGSILYRTSSFRKFEISFKYPVMDDIVPNYKLMMKGYGLFKNVQIINYASSTGSVSRRKRTYKEIQPVIKYLTELMYNSKDLLEFNIWNRALRNYMMNMMHNRGVRFN